MRFLLLGLLLTSCENSTKLKAGQCFLVDAENTIIRINKVTEDAYHLTLRVTDGTKNYQVPHYVLEKAVKDFNFVAEPCSKYRKYLCDIY